MCYCWSFIFLALSLHWGLWGQDCCHIHTCSLSDHLSPLHKRDRKAVCDGIYQSEYTRYVAGQNNPPNLSGFQKQRFLFHSFHVLRAVGWHSAPCHLYFGTLAEVAHPGSMMTGSWNMDKGMMAEDSLALTAPVWRWCTHLYPPLIGQSKTRSPSWCQGQGGLQLCSQEGLWLWRNRRKYDLLVEIWPLEIYQRQHMVNLETGYI